jgi:hypothetical protein
MLPHFIPAGRNFPGSSSDLLGRDGEQVAGVSSSGPNVLSGYRDGATVGAGSVGSAVPMGAGTMGGVAVGSTGAG